MIDHSEKHRLPTRKTRRNRSRFAARRRRSFLSFYNGAGGVKLANALDLPLGSKP
jgi:hypothetical protein